MAKLSEEHKRIVTDLSAQIDGHSQAPELFLDLLQKKNAAVMAIVAKELRELLDDAFPPDVHGTIGFGLLAFDYDEEADGTPRERKPGEQWIAKELHWVSSAPRDVMISAIEEFLAHQRKAKANGD